MEKFYKTVQKLCLDYGINCDELSTHLAKLAVNHRPLCKSRPSPQYIPPFINYLFHKLICKIPPVEYIFYPQSTTLIIKNFLFKKKGITT